MNSKDIYHRHHIVPRHMGGTDDPSNLVDLTVEQHAEAHRLLYEEHGKEEDRLAWLGLSGQIGKEELIRELSLLGASKGGQAGVESVRQWKKNNPEEYFLNCQKGGRKGGVTMMAKYGKEMRKKAQSPEARKTRKETLQKIDHQQGERNSQYGTMWITDGTNNKKLKKSEPIPDGWYKGRRCKWRSVGESNPSLPGDSRI